MNEQEQNEQWSGNLLPWDNKVSAMVRVSGEKKYHRHILNWSFRVHNNGDQL